MLINNGMAGTMAMDLERTFLDLASFIRVTASREEGATSSVAEATLLRLDAYIHFLNSFREALTGTRFYTTDSIRLTS